MKRFLLSAAVLILAAPAWADNAIRIVNPDGSVSVFEIPGDMPQVKSEPAPMPSIEKPAVPKVVEAKPEPARQALKIEAPKKVSVLKAAPAPERAATPVKAKQTEPVIEAALLPVPRRKPDLANPVAAPSLSRERNIISKNAAIGIAIRQTPPASDFRVFQRMYEGGPVYAVIFKTEGGAREVLVDAFTGEIIKKAKAAK